MINVLAIFANADSDSELLREITTCRPERVTVLLGDEDGELLAEASAEGGRLRDRLAGLLATIEHRTGASVIGLAGERAQLAGRQFDRELGSPAPIAA